MVTDTSMLVDGMTCSGCEARVRDALGGLEGVVEVDADHRNSRVRVRLDPLRFSEDQVRKVIRSAGFGPLARMAKVQEANASEPDAAPDVVPIDLLAHFEPEARAAVRRRRSRRHEILRRLRSVGPFLRDADVWATAAAVFMWGLLVLVFLGGIAFGIFLWPWAAVYVLVPLVTALGLSFTLARHLVARSRGHQERRSWPLSTRWFRSSTTRA